MAEVFLYLPDPSSMLRDAHWRKREAFGGKVDLFSFLFVSSKLHLITLWAGLGTGSVFDICEVFSWAPCRTSKPHYRLSRRGSMSSAGIRTASSFCMYHTLVLLPQLSSALVNQHSGRSEASPKDGGAVIRSCVVPIAIKFQHCLQPLSLFPWGHRAVQPFHGLRGDAPGFK